MIKKYNIEEIVKRYNDSISDFAAYKVALNEHQLDKQEKHLRDAGEGLSQVIEHSIKLHIYRKDPSRFQYYNSRIPLPQIIEELYLDKSNNKMSLFEDTIEDTRTSVDFAFIRDHKDVLTNISKHLAGKVDPNVVHGYIIQCKLFIQQYLDSNALLREVDYYLNSPREGIQQFYVACEHFRKENRTYILLTEKDKSIDSGHYQHFSMAPWDVIIDFDKKSMEDGLGSVAYNGGSDLAHIFKAGDPVSDEDFTTNIQKPIYFFANGYKNERSCVDFEHWNQIYYSKTEKFLKALSKCLTSQRTIVVSLLKDEDFIDNLRIMINRYLNNVKVVIANDRYDELLHLADRKNNSYEHVRTTLEEIDLCLKEYLQVSTEKSNAAEIYSIPFLPDEGKGILTKTELLSLEECFEVLYLGIGDGNDEVKELFLRGETPLTWQGAKRGFAAKRERFQRLYESPLLAEIKKGRGKVFIVHEPGFGGSTVARQLAYAIHESYPVLFLKEYHNKAVIQKLDWLHELTKKTIVVFMEIPSIISADEFEYLYRNSNQSRPYVFVGIKRGNENNRDIIVSEWANDTVLLSDKFSPIIETRYEGREKGEKLQVLNEILTGNPQPYQRTPFFFGLLTYEKDFMAAQGFFEKFAKTVEGNELQRKSLIYMLLCDYYADKPLPEIFFKTVFGVDEKTIFRIDDYFDEADGIVESLMQKEIVGNMTYIRPKYSFFSDLFLKKLLRKDNSPEDTGWIENLGTYCKELIKDAADNSMAEQLQADILQPLFIGSSREREGEKFTELVEKNLEEERINIFVTLHEQFPDNPHFCSHLARYYAMKEKNMEKALEYADRAIRLSKIPDPLLHHIKGMCLYYISCDKMEKIKKAMKTGIEPASDEVSQITDTLLSQAELEFLKSREIQQQIRHEDEYGYIPNIKLLLKVFDFYVMVNGAKKKDVIANAKEPYIIWLDKAQSLLENVRRLHEEGEESTHFIECETGLWAEYEDFGALIEKLNNQLVKTSQPAVLRRQLVQIYMRRDNEYKTSPKSNERLLRLMDENMKNDSKNIHNFVLWFRVARYSNLSTDEILAKLIQWKAISPAIDLSFYSYVFNTIKAIEGSSEAVILAEKYIKECRSMGGSNHIFVKEWYGNAPQGIVNNAERRTNADNYKLLEVTGYVTKYQHLGHAIIEMECGLEVFFKPSANGLTDSCLNHNVTFYLGFSYDGLRAESVKLLR